MKNQFQNRYGKTKTTVLTELENALGSLDETALERLYEDILESDMVFLTGVGRVLLSMQAFAKRLTHLGIQAHCVGDITEPAITERDLLIVASGSGESVVPLAIAKKAREIGCRRIVHIGSNTKSSMRKYVDYMVRIPTRTRLNLPDEMDSEQIMTSLFEQTLLIMGDILAKMIVDEKKMNLDALWKLHANLE